RSGGLVGAQRASRTREQFGNGATGSLPGSVAVTLTLSSGTGRLNGTTTLDLGTNAGNGVATFTDLQIDSAGTNKQLTASASGMTNALSSIFTVNSAPAARLSVQ